MLYMPGTTFTTPIVLQETQPVTTTRYYMLQPSMMVPTIPVINTSFVYPFVMKSIEKDNIEKSQTEKSIY